MSFEEKAGGSEMVWKKLWDVKPSIPPLSPEVLWEWEKKQLPPGRAVKAARPWLLRQLSVNARYKRDKRLRLRAVCWSHTKTFREQSGDHSERIWELRKRQGIVPYVLFIQCNVNSTPWVCNMRALEVVIGVKWGWAYGGSLAQIETDKGKQTCET